MDTIKTILLALACVFAPQAALAEVVMLSDPQTHKLLVPGYYWHYGCGPTAGGMMIGFWYGQGFDNLIEGQPVEGSAAEWERNKLRIKNMIASDGHIRDYYGGGYGVSGDDRTGTADDPLHADNSVADFMLASRDPLINGVTFTAYIYRGLSGYAEYCGYPFSAGGVVAYADLEERIKNEINAGRPIILYVDTPDPPLNLTDGRGDHYVVAMGYDDSGDTLRVAVQTGYDTSKYYDNDVNWLDFRPMSVGYEWGIGAGVWFNLFTAEQASWGTGGDVNGDALVNAIDLDLVSMVIDNEYYLANCDINMDSQVNSADRNMLLDHLVQIAGSDQLRGTIAGDANLDGVIDLSDFIKLKQSYGTTGGWSDGDFDFNGFVNLDDFIILKQNYGASIWPQD